ncbi:hypothetical protein A3Q56_05686 [Intoshia linei]|uniref:Uncharacterized protein n=1 Tax=Intoshia linei TaxID=1819745 RepID=A0A177AX77_9BILA|nr:hypothetical protein A3Q56_05686 [Intoshia linei]
MIEEICKWEECYGCGKHRVNRKYDCHARSHKCSTGSTINLFGILHVDIPDLCQSLKFYVTNGINIIGCSTVMNAGLTKSWKQI